MDKVRPDCLCSLATVYLICSFYGIPTIPLTAPAVVCSYNLKMWLYNSPRTRLTPPRVGAQDGVG